MAITYDGSRKNAGLKIYMDGKLQERYEFEDDLRSGIPRVRRVFLGSQKALVLGGIEDQKSYFSGAAKGLEAGRLDEMMFFNRRLGDREIAKLALYDPILFLQSKSNRTTIDEKRLLFDHLHREDAAYQILTGHLREYKIREVRTADIIVKPTMVMADMDTLRPTYILDRGQYDARGEEVTAATPTAVGAAIQENNDKTRLGLANWLFDERKSTGCTSRHQSILADDFWPGPCLDRR